jgi:hypothetical protein
MQRKPLFSLAFAAAMVITLVGCGGTDSTPTTGGGPSATAADGSALTVADRVETIKMAVSELRGLEFLEEVEIQFLTEEEFESYFGVGVGDSADEAELFRQGRLTYELLGLYTPGMDTEELDIGFARMVAGAWDPDDDVMILREGEIDALQELILVHELVHALQDQHFGDDLYRIDTLGDGAWVRSALVEGDARAVEVSYFNTVLTPREQNEANQAMRTAAAEATAGQPIPEFVLRLFTSAYEDGNRVMEYRDNAARNALLADLPDSSEQVLHETSLRDDEQPLPVELPTLQMPAYEPALEWSWGERGLREMLNTDGSRVRDAIRVGNGWGGDYFRSYVSADDEAIVTMAFRGDTKEDAVEYFDAMTIYLDENVPEGSYTEIRQAGDTVLVALASDPAMGDTIAASLFG